MPRSQKKYSSSSGVTDFRLYHSAAQDLAAIRGENYFVEKHESKGKGLQQGQSILSKYPSPCSLEWAQPKEMLLVHSCSVRGKQPTQHPSAGDRAHSTGSPRAWTICSSVSSLWRKDYCPRTPFRQEGKLNGSCSGEEWRHFLCWSRWCLEVIFSYMFSKLWKESITFKGPLFSISCSLQKWRNRVLLWKKSTKDSIKLPLHYK